MSALTVFETLDEVRGAVGRDLGTSGWVELTDERLAAYAEATGDETPGAPPLLALALTNFFLPQIVEVRGASMGVNYGAAEVRFPARAGVGDRLRGQATLVACEELPKCIQTTIRISVEVAGQPQPACVVDSLSRWFP